MTDPRAAATRLFVYGTLAPGRPNEHVLADLPGTWAPASVAGHLHAEGWGAADGYPGIVLDPHGPAVEGFLFESTALPGQWAMLDDFEGEEYQRVVAAARLGDGRRVDANVYTLRVLSAAG